MGLSILKRYWTVLNYYYFFSFWRPQGFGRHFCCCPLNNLSNCQRSKKGGEFWGAMEFPWICSIKEFLQHSMFESACSLLMHTPASYSNKAVEIRMIIINSFCIPPFSLNLTTHYESLKRLEVVQTGYMKLILQRSFYNNFLQAIRRTPHFQMESFTVWS